MVPGEHLRGVHAAVGRGEQLVGGRPGARLPQGHPAAREFATDRFARLRTELAARVAAQQKSGRIRDDVDAEAVAALVIAASDGLQTQWLLDESAPQHEALAVLERLLRGDGGAAAPTSAGTQ